MAATKMSTTVTSIEGGNVCELSPCLPNPCTNGGVCSISDVENGYVCACRSGYIGENCTQDRDECANGITIIMPNYSNTVWQFKNR